MNTFTAEIGSQPDLDFSTDDNDVHHEKKEKSKKAYYSSTKVKARNLLTNVSYRRFKQSNFNNLNFIIDILSFLLQNFNPINLDRKVDLEDERLMIKFLWEACIPNEFTRLIYKNGNNKKIADPKLTYQKANKFVIDWIQSETFLRNDVVNQIKENFKYIHYIYSLLYPKIYNRINHFEV